MKIYLGYSETMQEIAEVEEKTKEIMSVVQPLRENLSGINSLDSVPDQLIKSIHEMGVYDHSDKIRRCLLKVSNLAEDCGKLCESALKLSGDYSLHNIHRSRILRDLKSAEAILRILNEVRYIGYVKVI